MSPNFTIDSHHHFWDPSDGNYSWMVPQHRPINRIFTPDDFRPSLASARIAKTILVQTWSSYEETEHFLRLAAETDFIAGVVGWVDLTKEDVADKLDALLARPEGRWLVGIRHQVHDEADANWLLRDDVRRGLSAVAERDLVYDLLIRPRELSTSLQTVADFPKLRFVVDHMAKPDIRGRGYDAWAADFGSFKDHRSHVWCKLSGMVTEANWSEWRDEDIQPYIEKVIQIFGPDRCMFGSDWPVCLLAASYERTVELVRWAISYLSKSDQQAVFAHSAIEAYRLGKGKLL